MLLGIVKIQEGDVTTSSARHIAFLVNLESTSLRDFAYEVSQRLWPALERGKAKILRDIGSVASKTCEGKTYHALACYQPSADDVNTISEAMHAISACIEKIPTDEVIALVMNPYNWGLHTPLYLDLVVSVLRNNKKQIIWYMR